MADDLKPDLDDTVEMPAITDDDNDLMTRYEVAMKFRVTSQTVAMWVRRKPPVLTEVRNAEGRPRYQRTEVEELYRSGFRGGSSHE
jgi:hypothetical protein